MNNSRSGLDVDKLDYFQRDMSRTGVSTGTTSNDFERFIELARVMPAEPIEQSGLKHQNGSTGTNSEGEYPLMICYPEKMVRETVSLFATRFNMHQQVYTHKSVKEVEFMITDALKLADPYIRIQGLYIYVNAFTDNNHNNYLYKGNKSEQFPNGEYKMSETIHDMKAFMQMKDSILDIICHAAMSNPLLRPAQELIGRIQRRQLYRYVGMTSSLHDVGGLSNKSEKDILEELLIISMRNKEAEEVSFNLGKDIQYIIIEIMIRANIVETNAWQGMKIMRI